MSNVMEKKRTNSECVIVKFQKKDKEIILNLSKNHPIRDKKSVGIITLTSIAGYWKIKSNNF